MWLWDGDVGDKFGNNTDYFEMSVMPTDTGAPTASSSDFKTDVAQGATKVHFSVTVTVTIQLQGDEDTTDPDNDLTDVGPGDIGGDDGIEYTVLINKRANDPTADPIVDPTTRRLRVRHEDHQGEGQRRWCCDVHRRRHRRGIPTPPGNRVMG